jgi:hypothetical protein
MIRWKIGTRFGVVQNKGGGESLSSEGVTKFLGK